MPPTFTYPGVYIEEIPSGVHTITGVATSIAAFVGWAAKGSIKEATLVQSFADFESQFGGLDSRSLLGYSVNHFFGNGGQQAYIIRLVDPATAKPGTIAIPASGGGTAFTANAYSPGQWSSKYGVRIVPNPSDPARFTVFVDHDIFQTQISMIQKWFDAQRSCFPNSLAQLHHFMTRKNLMLHEQS